MELETQLQYDTPNPTNPDWVAVREERVMKVIDLKRRLATLKEKLAELRGGAE